MSVFKYFIAVLFNIILFYLIDWIGIPISNDAGWIGLCVLGAAFIDYQEKR